ncbi:elongation factor 1-gamma-A-like [Spea bombifrons]|uniref:elongation factor 1-gamma-A-like n=1 Tax=Spea bombifrons TaxID=233779 RepID=UPI00234BC906|nr:elongation factor 1-gamma-A-like [Spea bombifrons]
MSGERSAEMPRADLCGDGKGGSPVYPKNVLIRPGFAQNSSIGSAQPAPPAPLSSIARSPLLFVPLNGILNVTERTSRDDPLPPAGFWVFYSEGNWQIFPVLVAAKHGGLDLQLEREEAQAAEDAGTDKPRVKPSPGLKRPRFVEEEDGLTLHGYDAIVSYIASDELRGSGLREKSLIQLWLSFADKEVAPLVYAWVYPIMGLLPYHAQSAENAVKMFKKVMSVLESHLRTRTYMVGERLSVADIAVASALLWPYVLVFDPSFREPYISTNRWFQTCINNPAFVSALGEVPLCEGARRFQEGSPVTFPVPFQKPQA